MEEVAYKVLDFTRAISKKPFQDIIKELDSEGFSIEKTTLPEEQLKVFISILFVFHYDAVDITERPLFLKAVLDTRRKLEREQARKNLSTSRYCSAYRVL